MLQTKIKADDTYKERKNYLMSLKRFSVFVIIITSLKRVEMILIHNWFMIWLENLREMGDATVLRAETWKL